MDETYIKVKGKWCYLYRAIDKHGNMIDFMLSRKKDTDSAKRFFKKALKNSKYYLPYRINTDQYSTYNKAISELKEEGLIDEDTEHSKIKYLNNIVESDHFRIKKPMKLIGSFQNCFSAARTIKGMECMLMIKKRQCIALEKGIKGEVDFVNKLFGVYRVNCA